MSTGPRRLRIPWAQAWGELTADDIRPSTNGHLEHMLSKGARAEVLAVSGQVVPVLGLIAIVMGRDGQPASALIPDTAAQTMSQPVMQSNPRRAVEDDNGANDADD